jgi:hypothetical protein
MIALHVLPPLAGVAPERDVPQHSAAVIPVAGSSHPYPKRITGTGKESLHSAGMRRNFHGNFILLPALLEAIFASWLEMPWSAE